MGEMEVEGVEPESVVEEGVAEETPAAVEPEQFAISREEWEQTQNYLRATAPLLQQVQELVASGQLTPQQGAQVMQEQAPQMPEYDPFDPDSVNKFVEAKVGHMLTQALQEQFAPFQGLLGMVASEKGEALARAEMESIKSEIGEFDQDLAYVIASPIIQEGGDPSQAFRQVANYLKQRDAQIEQQAYERYKAEHQEGLQKIAGAPGETTGGGVGAEAMTVPTGPNRYKEAVDRALAARRATHPIG